MTAVVNAMPQLVSEQIRVGVQSMGLTINDQQVSQLAEYLTLFDKWNKAYNLSAIRKVPEMVSRHILDSLSVVPYIAVEKIIDVGTGGGLPGIPLAIIFPEKQFTLLDSNGKKTRFLFQVKTQLQLGNVTIENARVEKYHPEQKFDAVISRAFSSLKDMTDNCHHLLAEYGLFYAMKGVYPEHELREVEKHYKVSASHPLQVPGEEGQRHLLVLTS